MKNILLVFSLILNLGQTLKASDEIPRIVITGNLPTWAMHMTPQGVSASALRKAFDKEAARKKLSNSYSSRTVGALFIASTGVGFMVQSCEASNGNETQMDASGSWNDLTSQHSAGESTLDADIREYEVAVTKALNQELQATEDSSGSAFITAKGFVQRETLNHDGVMESFTTAYGFYFERQDRKGAISYIGSDANGDEKKKVRLIINAN